MSQTEAELWDRVDRAFPRDDLPRLKELNAKASAGGLSGPEREELVRLTDRMEEFEATRLSALADIAKLRGQSLSVLLDDLRGKRRSGEVE